MSQDNVVNLTDGGLVSGGNYFPKGGNGGLGEAGGWYCDTSQLVCPGIYTVSAVAFWEKGNRVAIKIGYYDQNNELQWIYNTANNNDYWKISENETYATLSLVTVPSGMVLKGLQLAQHGNQLGYNIYVTNPDGANPQWIQSSNDLYWPGSVENTYVDLNEVCLPKDITPFGFQVWAKGNRIAPSLVIG